MMTYPTVAVFIPKPTVGHKFVCGICNADVYSAIALDCFPVCAMCRWFCNVEGRWGRTMDGIK